MQDRRKLTAYTHAVRRPIRVLFIASMSDKLSIKPISVLERAPKQVLCALYACFVVILSSIHDCLDVLMEKGYLKSENYGNA